MPQVGVLPMHIRLKAAVPIGGWALAPAAKPAEAGPYEVLLRLRFLASAESESSQPRPRRASVAGSDRRRICKTQSCLACFPPYRHSSK